MTEVDLVTPDSPAARALAAADPRLGALIAEVGELRTSRRADRFQALARAIVGQQLSVKAAATIWSRVRALGVLTPEGILGADPAALRAAGLSGSKAAYLRDLAQRLADGRLDLAALDTLDDAGLLRSAGWLLGADPAALRAAGLVRMPRELGA